jgi:CO dehydrogenase/acetyl-CoA synthase epsilon subunit
MAVAMVEGAVVKKDTVIVIVVETGGKETVKRVDVTVVVIGIKMKKEEKKDGEVDHGQEVEIVIAATGAEAGVEREKEVEGKIGGIVEIVVK